MNANGIVIIKNIHPYRNLFCLIQPYEKNGVSTVVYSKPNGRKTEFK